MNAILWTLTIACLSCAGLLVAAEMRSAPKARALFKLLASTAFVGLAVAAGAGEHEYGQWILAALVLSWLGDALLLSDREPLFLLGIGAFLLAHVAYAVAFALLPLSSTGLVTGAALMLLVAAVTLRWLWPYLDRFFRVAVGLYVLALAVMCALAVSTAAATGLALLAIGALAFAASDISVARDRFVAPGVVNRVWGLPLYYLAQVLLALSILDVR